jgi:hypothetical protein
MHRGSLVQEGTLSELQAKTGCTSIADMFRRVLHEHTRVAEATP